LNPTFIKAQKQGLQATESLHAPAFTGQGALKDAEEYIFSNRPRYESVHVCLGSICTKLSKTRARSSGGIPIPVSPTTRCNDVCLSGSDQRFQQVVYQPLQHPGRLKLGLQVFGLRFIQMCLRREGTHSQNSIQGIPKLMTHLRRKFAPGPACPFRFIPGFPETYFPLVNTVIGSTQLPIRTISSRTPPRSRKPTVFKKRSLSSARDLCRCQKRNARGVAMGRAIRMPGKGEIHLHTAEFAGSIIGNSRETRVPLWFSNRMVPFNCSVSILTIIRPKPDDECFSSGTTIPGPLSSIVRT
jgi:hypothetical protein